MTDPRAHFRNLSIKNKLVFIVLAVSAAILILSAALSLFQTVVSGRQRLQRSMAVNAKLLGEYCVVPLSFDDKEEADRMLSHIQSIPWVRLAVLYDGSGRAFASYDPGGLGPESLDRAEGPTADRHVYGRNTLTYFHPVVYRDRHLGTLVLQAGTVHLRNEALRHAGLLAVMFALLILVTYVLALKMQRLISRPILDLAEATKRVSEKGDLSQRVSWGGQDEIGILYDGYNRMLEQLQERQRERDTAEEESRVRQQQLLQAGKLVTLGTLVSGVAHEINNPNAYIMLSSSLALKQWKGFHDRSRTDPGFIGPWSDPEVYRKFAEFFENMYRGSQRIDTIVKRLKDYYRKDQARAKVPVDINAVAEKAIEILDAKIRVATHDFRFLRGEALPPVLGNFQELEQVLINLLENACQALRDPSGSIRLRTSIGAAGNLLVTVEDTGVGIREENLERITDPFFTTKRESGGTGLGLSLALSIVSDHGGRLRFHSDIGKGTTAAMELPAGESHVDVPVREKVAADADPIA